MSCPFSTVIGRLGKKMTVMSSTAALDLPQKLDVRAGNDVTLKWAVFQQRNQKKCNGLHLI